MTSMLRVILVDDEEPALYLLERMMLVHHDIEVVGKYMQPKEAIEAVRDNQADAAFLDIQMPAVSGIETAEAMREIRPDLDIVFVTAYDQYAIKAFEQSAIDYILKPPVQSRIDKTVEQLLWRHIARLREAAASSLPYPWAEQMPRTRFHCFDRFEWVTDTATGETAKWRRAKERELTAYLIHQRNSFVAKEEILEQLWPEAPPEQSTAYLHTCIHYLRKMLKACGAQETIEYRHNSYRIKAANTWCDVDQLAAASAMEITKNTIHQVERALTWYKGDYMQADGYLWAQDAEEIWRETYIAMQKRLAEYYMKQNNLDKVAACLQSALQYNPFPDDLNEMLLSVYGRMGDRHSLMRHYQHFVVLLNEELGISPTESTVQLYQRSLAGSS